MMAADSLLVLSAWLGAAALALRLDGNLNLRILFGEFDWFTLIALGVFPLVFYVFELYEQERWLRNTKLLFFITAAVLCGSTFMAISSYVLRPGESPAPMTLGASIICSSLFLFVFRKMYVRLAPRTKITQESILLIGNDILLQDILQILGKHNGTAAVAVTRVEEYLDAAGTDVLCDVMTGESVHDILQNTPFSTIVASTDLMKFPLLKQQLIDLRFAGVKVYDTQNFYEALTTKVAVHHIRDSWFLFRNQGTSFHPGMYLKIKKMLEKCLSLVLLIALAPVMLLIALAIKCSSPGPVLYSQQRMGKQGKEFTLYKFRTMVANAADEAVPVWLKRDEARITGIGRLLRQTRLDELPQLYNIIKGDMSVTGPRPIRAEAAALLAEQIPYYRLRFMVKPGLTGWAQVRGGYGHTIEEQLEKLEYDLYYIQNQSALFDLFILLKTVQSMLFGKGR